MSAKTTTLTQAARDALTRALMDVTAYRWWSDKPDLTLHAVSTAVTRALLAVLTDTTAVEWDGQEGGLPYRTYRGTLPCGLSLEIVTFRDEVPNLLRGAS